MHFLLKATETIFNVDTTSFLNCKQTLNYKSNLQSRLEYKCKVSNKSHMNKDKDIMYLILKKVKFFYKYCYSLQI